MRVTLTINKKSVYEEVGKAASYVGAKMDADTYDRMMVTDENEELLDSFWEEAKTTALNSLKEWLAEGKEDAGNFFVPVRTQGGYAKRSLFFLCSDDCSKMVYDY